MDGSSGGQGHYSVDHTGHQPSSSRGGRGYRGGRQACNVCKDRKTKCDRAEPRCGRCTRLGHKCSYDSAGREVLSNQLLQLQARIEAQLGASDDPSLLPSHMGSEGSTSSWQMDGYPHSTTHTGYSYSSTGIGGGYDGIDSLDHGSLARSGAGVDYTLYDPVPPSSVGDYDWAAEPQNILATAPVLPSQSHHSSGYSSYGGYDSSSLSAADMAAIYGGMPPSHHHNI